MSAKVVSLVERRKDDAERLAAVAAHAARPEEPLADVPLAVQAAPGSVTLVTPAVDLVFSPDQAFELAKDIWNAARDAKGETGGF